MACTRVTAKKYQNDEGDWGQRQSRALVDSFSQTSQTVPSDTLLPMTASFIEAVTVIMTAHQDGLPMLQLSSLPWASCQGAIKASETPISD